MPTPYERLVASVYDAEAIELIEPPQYLIKDVLDFDSLAQFFGPPGAGKSAVVHGMALHVAMGMDWYDHPVRQGNVLYVAAEGSSGMGVRQRAWKAHHRIERISGIEYMTVAPNLTEYGDRQALLQYVDETKPVLTILDTLARHLPGGDDNTGPTMSIMIETMEAVKRLTGGCACTIHHSGWGATDRGRGHSSLEGALDHSIRVRKLANCLEVYAAKHKNHADHYPIMRMQLKELAGSIVAVPDASLSPAELLALECLVSACRETLSGPLVGVESHAWEAACDAKGISRASYFRYKSKLLDLGEVVEKDRKFRSLSESQGVS